MYSVRPCGYSDPKWWAVIQIVSSPAAWSERWVVHLWRLVSLMLV